MIPSNCNSNNGYLGYRKSTEEAAYHLFLKQFKAHKDRLVVLVESLG
jgi:hypothetical protein